MDDIEYKKMIKKSFDNASKGYDNDAMRFFDNSAEHLVRSLDLKGDEHVLDVSTGTGKSALLLAERLDKGHVTGIDLSEGMLEQARKKAQERGLTNLTFTQKDIEKIDFPLNHFDQACCSFGIFFLSDMQRGMKKIKDVVKPQGGITITGFTNESFRPLSDLLLDRFKKYGVKLPDHYTWERMDHPDKHRDLFESAGLSNVESHKKQVGYYLKNKEQWWDIVYYSGFRGFFNKLNEEDQPRFKEENLAEIEAIADESGIWLNVEVIFTTGFKIN